MSRRKRPPAPDEPIEGRAPPRPAAPSIEDLTAAYARELQAQAGQPIAFVITCWGADGTWFAVSNVSKAKAAPRARIVLDLWAGAK